MSPMHLAWKFTGRYSPMIINPTFRPSPITCQTVARETGTVAAPAPD